MKYVIDVDAFKSVLDLLPTYVARDGDNLIEIDDVKKLLDSFPKEEVPNYNTNNLRCVV